MNSFTDIKVIECNRLHSEEAKSNNDENFALWTNNDFGKGSGSAE